jgi:cellulose synthase/poly-beta-1,6-N-acetylglucosamine synthase-like glycosyltransferase
MNGVLMVLFSILVIVALLPVIVFFVEVLFSIASRKTQEPVATDYPRLAIVMPAHNEELIIAAAIRSIVPQLRPTDRFIVVADNCSDKTTSIAVSEGAEVIIRSDEQHRGKGYALDFGIRHLERASPPEVVVVMDADCLVTAGAIEKLSCLCARVSRPVQALYLMSAPPNAGIMTRIGAFAWLVKNQVRPLGLKRLRLPCQLMGTGMAFPWKSIQSARLATGQIVEDLKLGIDLAIAGTPPLFCPEALVSSMFPTVHDGIRSQRTRWEHGHLAMIVSEAPRLLIRSLATLDFRLAAMALDLSVPPLALQTLVIAALWISAGIFFVQTAVLLPLALATLAAALLVMAVFLSWARYGRDIISLRELTYAFFYAVGKIPLYAKFLVARQLDWVRSKRDGDGTRPK